MILTDTEMPVDRDTSPPHQRPPAVTRNGRSIFGELWRGTRVVLPGVVALAIVFGGWQIGVDASHVSPIELVAPSAVFAELWRARGAFTSNAWVTLQEAFWGFLVAFGIAIVAAALMAHSKIMDRALAPLVVLLQVTPVLALAPPLVLWLGFGPQPKIIVAALITFVPLVVNATVGFRAIDPATLEVLRSVNATRTEIFFRLRVPHSVPYVVAAVRVCVGLALIGAVVAEFIGTGASAGLGFIMLYATQHDLTSELWAAIFTLILLGIVLVGFVQVAGSRLTRWADARPADH
ncbi:MAG: ABC transporter permease [Acidimicrobiales bacterium]